MVAVIKAGHSMNRVFQYNENKVKEGVAACIGAENYPLNAEEMSEKIKLGFLLKQVKLNENVKRNSVHISLNFHPSESHFSKEKLLDIASVYMERIGFGKQPYLVYQHRDAGHPHLHLVTTNIQADGRRIDLHHLGIRKSEPARKEVEKMFGLVAAENHGRQQAYRLEPIDARRVQYGRVESKRAIAGVLLTVLEKYHYTSLPELNAVLQQYNVLADRGSEESRIFKSGGLVYRILDGKGSPVGVPIKASDFYSKPTLRYLEGKYSLNDARRQPFKARIKSEIDRLFMGKPPTLQALVSGLERKGIHVALRKNDAGLVYGITYVDHQTKCVFNGSALGKQYSAKGIQGRCCRQEIKAASYPHAAQKMAERTRPFGTASRTAAAGTSNHHEGAPPGTIGLILEGMSQPEFVADFIPGQLKKGRKKKKRKNISNN